MRFEKKKKKIILLAYVIVQDLLKKPFRFHDDVMIKKESPKQEFHQSHFNVASIEKGRLTESNVEVSMIKFLRKNLQTLIKKISSFLETNIH